MLVVLLIVTYNTSISTNQFMHMKKKLSQLLIDERDRVWSELFERGLSMKEIAEMFNTHRMTVKRVLDRDWGIKKEV